MSRALLACFLLATYRHASAQEVSGRGSRGARILCISQRARRCFASASPATITRGEDCCDL